MPISRAHYWGKQGCKVSSLKVVLSEDAIAVRVDCHSGDTLGHYKCIVGFGPPSKRFYIFLEPSGLAYLGYSIAGTWIDGATLGGSKISVQDSSISAVVPLSSLLPAIAQDIASQVVDLHLDYTGTNGRELFLFPGSAIPPRRAGLLLISGEG